MIIENEYKRLSDESQDDYVWRMCSNKDAGKYDLKWGELADILNEVLDEGFTESKWRKNYQMMKKGYDRAIEKNTQSEEAIDELKLAKIELQMEKKKVQTENVYKNRILREHAREELLKERVESAIKNAEKIPLPKFEKIEGNNGKFEYILGFSDVHAYKKFKSITNEYSKEILEKRMALLMQEVIEVVKSEGIEKITVINGGDDLEGILRTSALSILELGVQDTIIEYRRFIATWLRDLSVHVKITYIQMISSNHTESRPLGTRAGQFPKEDFEKDIATYILDILSNNERIEVIVPETAHYHLKLAGKDILIHHGHNIGNPKKYLDSMSRKLKVWFSTLIVGHLHSEELKPFYEDIDGGDVELIRLPSIVGTCEYADTINEGSKSAALWLRINEKKGRDREYKFILN